jgi:trans-o-hydroxybenzylidenepyruvate hydratase-aldolase
MATKRKLLTVDDVKGVWAIMPTPAKDNAPDWRAEDTVDLDETARAVEGLVVAGIDGILSLGTLGECATLTWEEKKKFIATAVETVRGRVPFFAGTTSLNTRETIRQTREAYKLGADGTMLGLPMWCTADIPTAVRFYKDVAEACPEMAICVYANPQAFRFTFPTEFWAQVSEIPQVITAKYGAGPNLDADIAASKKRIRFMPIDMQYFGIAKSNPEFNTAFWTSGAVCGPKLAVHLRDVIARAKSTREWSEAEELTKQIAMTVMPLIPNGSFEEFGKYNIGLEKARMDAGGWMKAGPCRPPYVYVPEEYLKGARAAGAGWAALEQKIFKAKK